MTGNLRRKTRYQLFAPARSIAAAFSDALQRHRERASAAGKQADRP